MAVFRPLPSNLILLFLIFVLSLYGAPLSVSIGDDEILLEFKESLDNTAVVDQTWKKGTSPCDDKWIGVRCSNGTIIGLYLSNLGLSGDVDIDALKGLQGLRAISFAQNKFSGPMPGFNQLGALKALFLSDNDFSGEIPSDMFSKMGSLKKLELQGNRFFGQIPASLGKLQNLIELRLEDNEFSGPIPEMAQPSLVKINLSNNKLEGEIPESMRRFGTTPFEGNPDLCGQVLSKECTNNDDKVDPTTQAPQGSTGTKWAVLGVVVALLLVTILFKAESREENFSMLAKENLDEVVPVHLPSTNRRSISSRKGNDSMHSSRRGGGGSQHGKSSTDLVMINEEKGVFGLPDLMKAAAEVLGSGGLGSAYKAVMSNGLSVVVKRLRDMNKLNKDTFDMEIRKLGRIRHRNILTPLAYHYRKEEKLLVSEYVPKGSLLYILHGDRGISHAELNWPTRLKIVKGVARGMGFLHTEFATYELPHGNLKSSNILLGANYEPLLTDYALYPLISSTNSVQALFAYKSPEAILYQQLTQRSDVYCLGIVILEIVTGKFPSQYVNNQKGGIDLVQWVRSAISENRLSELIDPEIAGATESIGEMEKLLHIAAACTESEYDKRVDMKDAIRRIEEVQVQA